MSSAQAAMTNTCLTTSHIYFSLFFNASETQFCHIFFLICLHEIITIVLVYARI